MSAVSSLTRCQIKLEACYMRFTTTRGLARRGAQFTTKEEDREAEVVQQSYKDVDQVSKTKNKKVGSETILPQTPPLVVKPPGPSDCKSATISDVQRALFQEPLPERGSRTMEELAPQAQSEKA